jgi:hypothetical protein
MEYVRRPLGKKTRIDMLVCVGLAYSTRTHVRLNQAHIHMANWHQNVPSAQTSRISRGIMH